MSLWFTASAAAPELIERWSLEPGEAGWLTSAVQLGFVVGTFLAAVLNLADLLPGRAYFVISAILGATANAALAAAPGFRTALLLRFLTGASLAGVYPPAMKMIATWFRSARGLAVGILIGSLTLGKGLPYLIRGLVGDDLTLLLLLSSLGAVAAAALVGVSYRDGPHPFERRPFSWSLAGSVLRHRETRLAIGGYLGHMWELYAMWTWAPAFIAASLSRSGGVVSRATGDLIAFGALATGALGCLWGGWASDRIGRERLVSLAMAASGACCLLVGAVYGQDPALLTLMTWTWGFFVVADSAQFSTLVTELAPPHAVGTALTLQTCLGFLLTAIPIQIVPFLAERWGWRWAFPILAAGPIAGIGAIRRLAGARAA